MHLFAEKIKKNIFLVVILSQFARSNAIFLKRDYSTLLFSVEYEGTFTTKHDDVQHTHQDGALSMPFFIQNFLNNKSAIVMTSTNVTIRYRIAMCKGKLGRRSSTEVQQIEDSICYCCQAHRTGRV